MRAYFLTNFYLSSIQKGIQAQHCTAELFVEYTPMSAAGATLYEWAEKHKTTIVLNGGNCKDLNEAFLSIRAVADELKLPYTTFSEDKDSLNGAITCVGIILPERIYNTAEAMRNSRDAKASFGLFTLEPIEGVPADLQYGEYVLALLISNLPLAS